MTAKSYSEVLVVVRRDFESLKRESTAIREAFGASTDPKFHMSLYALLMAAFAQADIFASLWKRSSRKKHTDNLRDFLTRFAKRDETAVVLAVQLYRHTLMHTGRPRELLDERTDSRHYFLLHWGLAVADAAAHFTVNESGKLTLNLESLLEDLDQALARFEQEAATDSAVQHNIEAHWQLIALQRFSS